MARRAAGETVSLFAETTRRVLGATRAARAPWVCVESNFGAPYAIDATCFRSCDPMAWRFHAIDTMLSP